MNKILNLTRLNKPIGIYLLFLPCLFGIALSYKYNNEVNIIKITLLFFVGSIVMRSAGCIINDICDRNFDKQVSRTKNRPLACKDITVNQALLLLIFLLLVGLAILLQFNIQTIILGISSLILVVIYPLTKRITYYPQIFLGLTFNFGILMASSTIIGYVNFAIFTLYLSAIFWTIVYDTIYAYQDIEDDTKIGVKSTAIKFGSNPRNILYILSTLQTLFLIISGIFTQLNIIYYILISLTLSLLVSQIKNCDFKDGKDCLKKFKNNLWIGIIILIAIIIS